MNFSKVVGLAGLLLLAQSESVFAQRDFSGVEIKTIQVAGNIYMLEGSGGNIGVSVGEDGILIIDDQFAPLAEKIEAALDKLSDSELKFILNTHWHGDHTGGNAHFGKQAPIIAHHNVRKRLAESQDRQAPKEALPVVTFEDGLSLHFNGEEIKVIHAPPGHTDGDSVVHFTGSNVVHMGDQFFNGRFPFIDLNSGGDVTGYIKNVKTALDNLPEDVKLIPGHGALGTRADLERFHNMLTETTGIIKRGMDEGKTLAQLQEAGLPNKWSEWSSGFISTDRWIEIVHNGLKGK